MIEWLRGNADAAGGYGRLAIDVCTAQRVPNYLAVGHIFAGHAAASTGAFEQGMTELQEGLTRYRELGAERLLAAYLLPLAELCLTPGHCEAGIAAVHEAAALVERTGEVRWAPEIKRLKGELLLVKSAQHRAEADALFRDAREVAATQGSKSFELRAATSLAASLHDAGDLDRARKTLAPIYEQFTEGFDTRDLRRANALLRELS
ncbi:MAG TPA: hypothetical protein VE175_01980, partial [Woeseiaceae bacterium]|nr:hypothetical protein [Woeseiaceae bacterium]